MAAFIYMLYIILRTIIRGLDVPGYASIVVLILFIGGVQLITIGILGEYLAKTYMEVKQRPIFIIREMSANKNNVTHQPTKTSGRIPVS
jgi:glycosyltransferase involved in cell wall biosynthesis